MDVISTTIPGVLIIRPSVFSDNRGGFFELYNSTKYQIAGMSYDFVQDNVSMSNQGTIRGLHYQIIKPQGKLIQILRGSVYDVAVDLRQSSNSFGKWTGNYLRASEYSQLWIPPGFAHGYYVISDDALIFYKVTNYYSPKDERIIIWNDSSLSINWPITEDVPLIISDRDAQGISFMYSEEIPKENL